MTPTVPVAIGVLYVIILFFLTYSLFDSMIKKSVSSEIKRLEDRIKILESK